MKNINLGTLVADAGEIALGGVGIVGSATITFLGGGMLLTAATSEAPAPNIGGGLLRILMIYVGVPLAVGGLNALGEASKYGIKECRKFYQDLKIYRSKDNKLFN